MRARQALESQSQRFRGEAQHYMTEARDITQVEVAQAKMAVESNYQSALQYTRQAAESAMGAQRERFISEAESAMQSQKVNLVSEAEAYMAKNRAKLEDEYQKEFKLAEGNLLRKEKDIQDKLDAAEDHLKLHKAKEVELESDFEKRSNTVTSGLRSQLKEANAKICRLQSLNADLEERLKDSEVNQDDLRRAVVVANNYTAEEREKNTVLEEERDELLQKIELLKRENSKLKKAKRKGNRVKSVQDSDMMDSDGPDIESDLSRRSSIASDF